MQDRPPSLLLRVLWWAFDALAMLLVMALWYGEKLADWVWRRIKP